MSISVRRSSKTVFLNSFAWPDSVCVRAMKKWPSFRTSIWQRTPSASFSSLGAGAASASVPFAAEAAGPIPRGSGGRAAAAAARLALPSEALLIGLPDGAFGTGTGALEGVAGLAADLAAGFAGALAVGLAVLAGVLLAGTRMP